MPRQIRRNRLGGRVVDRRSKLGLPGFEVEAWDSAGRGEVPVGSCRTNADGGFELEFAEHYLDTLFGAETPSLSLRVTLENDVVHEVAGTVELGPARGPRDRLIAIDLVAVLGSGAEAAAGAGDRGRIVAESGAPLLAGAKPRSGEADSALRQGEKPAGPRTFAVAGEDGGVVHRAKLRAGSGKRVEIRVPRAQTSSPAVADLARESGVRLSAKLAGAFAKDGIKTVADLQGAGGVAQVGGIDFARSGAARKLDAQVDLSRISDDPEIRQVLHEAGLSSVNAVGVAERADVVRVARKVTGDFKAASLAVGASAQKRFVDTVLAGVLAENAGSFVEGPLIDAERLLQQPRCGCEDCEAAVSPLAYLTDLLDYAIHHVKSNDAPIELDFLERTFHQPFGKLPADCRAMEEPIRQVRLCVEVLRSYLASNPPAAAALTSLQAAESAYRIDAYETLLTKLGASYDDVRLARSATSEERVALAGRLGIDLGSGQQDNLERLFLDPAVSPATLSEPALEEIFGLIDTTRDPLAGGPTPLIETWRREHLRTLWRSQDWPLDQVSDGRPLIDPDVIGPDDFRKPARKATAADPDGPFDIWIRRREWVDSRLQALAELTHVVDGETVPDIDAMLASMYASVSYGTPSVKPWKTATKPADFASLGDDLTRGVEVETAAARIAGDLGLGVEAFNRLVAVLAKNALATTDPRNEPVGSEEWGELRSILVQAQKARLLPAWSAEEQAAGVMLGPRSFWISLGEPKEGIWPPAPRQGSPLIDPGAVAYEDLPEPTVGRRARELWELRSKRIVEIAEELRKTREASGFDAMVRVAIGNPGPADPPPHDLGELRDQLGGADPALAESARRDVVDDLHLSPDAFLRLMAIGEKDEDPDPLRTPTAAEWAEAYAILAPAQTAKREFPAWVAEEQDPNTGVPYWAALKARLPRWLAPAEVRAEWQRSLTLRSGPPIVDPDLIGPGDMQEPTPGNPAYDIWVQRRAWVDQRLADIRATRESQPGEPGFQAAVSTTLGVPAPVLDELVEQRASGESIRGRLDQLGLPIDAFTELIQVGELAATGSPVLESEWAAVYAILASVQKRMAAADWRDQEEAAKIALDPAVFRLPSIDSSTFPPPALPPLPAWLASETARRDWQDRLASRIEQEQQVLAGIADAIGATEAATMPKLRDALVLAASPTGLNLEAGGKRLTEVLLIDARDSGCSKTTRIAQAIETIQGLLFSLRTRQLEDAYPGIDLVAEQFDEEWEWIGSYETWRAAMFVYLYPENLLIPSLQRWQSPAFRQLVSELRSNRQLTARQACTAANAYEEYFRDVCSLTPEASCQTMTRIHSGDCRDHTATSYRSLLHMFARGGTTKKVYWSTYDPLEPSDRAQSFWAEVPALSNVVNLVGAVAYQPTPNDRVLLLFARSLEKGTPTLVFASYDLERGTWSEEVTALDPPKEKGVESPDFDAVLKQHGREWTVPHLAVRMPGGAIYDRHLNRDATDWEDADWAVVAGPARGSIVGQLLAMVEIADDEHYLVGHDRSGDVLLYRLFGARDDGAWRTTYTGQLAGAFSWPGTSDAFLACRGNGPSGPSELHVLKRSSAPLGTADYSNIWAVEAWLENVTGVSLEDWIVSDSTLYAGMTLMRLFTLPAQDDPYLVTGPWPSQGFWNAIRDVWWRSRVSTYIDYIGSQLERDDGWKEWKLANEFVKRYAGGKALADVLRAAFEGQPTAFARRDDGAEVALADGPPGIERIATTAGASSVVAASGKHYPIAFGDGEHGVQRCTLERWGDHLSTASGVRIAPLATGPFEATERLSEAKLQLRRLQIESAYKANESGPASNLTYLEEAYYSLPMHLGLQLQGSGEFTAALDWMRNAYDYSQPVDGRKIWYGLRREETLTGGYTRPGDWLLDPLNPHAIAAVRPRTYSRFTILAIVQCLLDFADAEFTRDTAESVPRARILYSTALELLDSPELKQRRGRCEDVIGQLEVEIGDPHWETQWWRIREELGKIRDPRTLERAVDAVGDRLGRGGPLEQRLIEASSTVSAAIADQPDSSTVSAVLGEKATTNELAHRALVADARVAAAAREVGSMASSDFSNGVALVAGKPMDDLERAKLPWLREQPSASLQVAVEGAKAQGRAGTTVPELRPEGPGSRVEELVAIAALAPRTALKIVQAPVITWVPAPSFAFCIPPNPLLRALRMRAELNLYKIRTCRNIAGVVRELEPYAAPTDTVSGMPTIGVGGQLAVPGANRLEPTPYRYPVLVERAKQTIAHAEQVEASLLGTLEKRDAEYYTLMRARQDVRVTQAGVRLQDLRVSEAEGGVTLAELQQERAQIQADYYQGLLDEGVSELESAALALLGAAATLQLGSAIASFVGAALPSSIGLGGPSYSPQGSAGAVASGLSSVAASLSTTASILSTLASYERRAQEWEFQKSVAQQDVRIGGQQIKIAEDHVRVTAQERAIADMQAQNTATVADYLANKFTNVELYDWMSGVLERVYSFFLQQATSVARLAEAQLAFERQEPPPPLIQADYWEAPSEGAGALGMPGGGGQAPDRRGLTGAARLLQDLYDLDEYAFETGKRKLQLTKAISLAHLSPAEFQRFKETGLLQFATPMELFDRDFPGHYLRLINRVQTTVVALVPPINGIHATLTNGRLSRVVIGSGGVFQRVSLQHGPDTVALSSPRDASGIFELDPQSDMLRPFEGVGVDATWEFRMPMAANQLDYDAIADVMLSIEYTALDSADYRQQVVGSLSPDLSGDRPFSFRHNLPDLWYDLNNPDQTATPMVVRFSTTRADFPPNLDRLRIAQVVLYFTRADGAAFEVQVSGLRFTEEGTGGSVGGAATSVDGVISTRRGNAGSWTAMIGKAPQGTWELAFPDTAETREWFASGRVEDILFVITYSGRTPDWPV